MITRLKNVLPYNDMWYNKLKDSQVWVLYQKYKAYKVEGTQLKLDI